MGVARYWLLGITVTDMYKVKPEFADYVRLVVGEKKPRKLSEYKQSDIEKWAEQSPQEVEKYFTLEVKSVEKAEQH